MKIAVIPARGNSKRIPRKNIRPFAGKPIIAYSIEAAKESGLFDHIVVSTDNAEIAETAVACGAETPFVRPTNLADDFTNTDAVAKHAIEWFMKQGETVQYACCIYPTPPFLQPRYLRRGFECLSASDKLFAFSVTSFSFPVQRAIRITVAGTVEAMYPENISTRSQDLDPAYHDAGQFYWARSEGFLDGAQIFSPASLPIILPRHLVQDIDTLEDWYRAELMYRAWMLEIN